MNHNEMVKLERLPKQFNHLSIAIFDPEGMTGELLKKRFEKLDMDLVEFRSHEEINLSVANNLKSFDLFIIDLDKHEEEGFGLANAIRKHKVSRPEILFTSSNPKITVFDCHQVGAFGLLSKPLDLNELRVLTHQVTDRRDSTRFDVDAYPGIIKRGNRKLATKVKNIGRGGIFIELQPMDIPPKIGELIDFSVDVEAFPNFILEGQGVVRWTKGGKVPGFGVEFVSIPDEAHNLISAFVELFKIRPFVPTSETEN